MWLGVRHQVDKLVAVRRLLKRLEFLFDLPINLTRYVQVCYRSCACELWPSRE